MGTRMRLPYEWGGGGGVADTGKYLDQQQNSF